MKKIGVYIFALLLLVFILGPLMSRKSLIITNIKYFPVSEWTKDNLVVAYFNFDDIDISLKEVGEHFTHTDSLIVLSHDKKMSRDERYRLSGYNRPLFEFEISQYFFYAIIKNHSIAGEESLFSEAHYIWLPWGWYNVKDKPTGAA